MFEHSVFFFINGYGFFLYSHLCIGSINQISAEEVAQAMYKNISTLPDVERNLFLISFQNKKILEECSVMSIIKIGEDKPLDLDGMLLACTLTFLHRKLVTKKIPSLE